MKVCIKWNWRSRWKRNGIRMESEIKNGNATGIKRNCKYRMELGLKEGKWPVATSHH